ncbi:hypothetical protein F3Y22_tig00111392pilonHSYRG00334 [Hibiscus syriacus]|uniref:3-hydroxyacyl-CoA dehydrogenase NAD binding domain-containing protein n=1 Tax=Hibiscus syriacus TaxID=106335 RepID=A0A6A2YLL0_HIBSY|nr:hypothetical protein F3Y22_tig00111392pilonHSYRG00334 [Hibiscus syriacus]
MKRLHWVWLVITFGLGNLACNPAIWRHKVVLLKHLEHLRSADFIVEAIVESKDVKKKLFIELDKIAKCSAILASNTSSISITRFASETSRQHQVIGMHFMNPPPVMKLVEIVRGADTSDETFHDYPGFIVNRILKAMINEAFFTLYTGVATKEDIDTGKKLGTNHPMGDNKYAPYPLLVHYVGASCVGRKCGIGPKQGKPKVKDAPKVEKEKEVKADKAE